MELDYSIILSTFADVIVKALPISFFLVISDILISLFFSLAFPKFTRKGD